MMLAFTRGARLAGLDMVEDKLPKPSNAAEAAAFGAVSGALGAAVAVYLLNQLGNTIKYRAPIVWWSGISAALAGLEYVKKQREGKA